MRIADASERQTPSKYPCVYPQAQQLIWLNGLLAACKDSQAGTRTVNIRVALMQSDR